MNVIVTGAAGFIGSHVAKDLIQKGHTVLALDDLSGGNESNIPKGAIFLKASINDDLLNAFKNFKPDFVYHLAAYAAEGLSHHIPSFNYQNNVLGTINVLNSAYHAGAKHFVFTSSIAAYGHPHNNEIFDESSYCIPCDPYGTAKLACEHHIRAFVDYFGAMKYTIFRPHNVFGPNQNISDPYRNVVGIFMAKAMQGLPMPIFGDGSQTRSFSFINVVAESIAEAPFNEDAVNQTFNIGGDESMTVKELAEQISEAFSIPLNIEWLSYRKEVAHAHCTHDKAKRVFSAIYNKSVSIKEGLKMMADSVKKEPIPQITECPSPIEIFELLPPSWAARLAIN
ncbi:MAG: NAD-dependent epimerase/dehydratase family protein [Chitinophagaceae bacterium]|nr:NAD-dependent epimerase/dehydratase family protein [Chitinophagaceae bacterium]